MRVFPEPGPLLLPTVVDILVRPLRAILVSAVRLVLIGLVLFVPAWFFCAKGVPVGRDRSRLQSHERQVLDPSAAPRPHHDSSSDILQSHISGED
jgi:hypothetical protein